MTDLRILAITAATGRVGYVFLANGELKDWRISGLAAQSNSAVSVMAQNWIDRLKPEVVVTEKVEQAVKKGAATKGIIKAIAETAADNCVLDVSVARHHDFANKYEEVEALAQRYPAVKNWLPQKRRFFDNEPRNTVLFEAPSLAESIDRGPTNQLAAAMG